MEHTARPPILILTHEFAPTKGGIATFAEEMARAATQLGRSVELWAPKAKPEREEDYPFQVRRLDLKGTQDLACQARLAREIIRRRRLFRGAVVYLCEPGPILAMRYLQFFTPLRPRKLILTFHGSEVNTFASHPGKRLAVRALLKRADRISAPSHFTRSLLERRFPVAAGKTILTPCALRSRFTEAEAKPNGRRADKVHILTVGRLHPRKGQAHILRALAQLPPSLRRQLSLWIVGSGRKRGYENELRALAERSDFSVTFFGDVSDKKLEELYGEAHIFSLTSVNFRQSVEGFGLVYLEAAAHGLPIVAHRVGGVGEAVAHERNGILTPPGDTDALAAAFARLVEDRELREKMGQSGRRWARRHTWLQSADLLFNRWGPAEDPVIEEAGTGDRLVASA